MTLSSFLLGAEKRIVIDKGLDAIFNSTTGSPMSTRATSASEHGASSGKRKMPSNNTDVKPKRHRTGKDEEPELSSNTTNPVVKLTEDLSNLDSERASERESRSSASTHHDAEVPTPHIAALANGSGSYPSNSDDEGDMSQLVHESLIKKVKGVHGVKAKYIPENESSEQRDARTIFVGNVPVEITKSRPFQKQFKRHILSQVPDAQIESVRFRSVAFQNPTSKLPTLDSVSSKKLVPNPHSAHGGKEGRQHDRERAASWRSRKAGDEEEPGSVKSFLTPKEKKRVAFIKHEIHSGVDAVNAYVVFAHAPPAPSARAANVPPPRPIMDPYEAASLAAERCDRTVFMDRTIRVDRVGKGHEEDSHNTEGSLIGDPKATVFVGNLDFGSKEEDLRVFFEGLVIAERGSPTAVAEAESEDEDLDDDEDERVIHTSKDDQRNRQQTWVKRVRIVRDKDTQLGKGFAYVQFVDQECVDEILALEQDRLKFAKRKLRVQRCKSAPGGVKVTSKKSRPPAATAAKSSAYNRPQMSSGGPTHGAPLPKGDSELGRKISHLPKEERKKAKAADADRVARRLAKKKAKLLAEKGVKPRTDRERVRKRPGERKGSDTRSKRKGRVRSGKALGKMNIKK
ncbi:uncharacterized protein FIBRA_03216 [Fibroporia radiculosa]|uniref:Nucleolar protein 12 n=1 Tax=Fibroporia radiculosa TaxID=599839 RepID=J4G4L2_9APHY|nr:uncharacterized protein FIBRA_03216 [Fibroporia radiculosa]CCM01168.1 predicted protein [Fibroporia radiculosa]